MVRRTAEFCFTRELTKLVGSKAIIQIGIIFFKFPHMVMHRVDSESFFDVGLIEREIIQGR